MEEHSPVSPSEKRAFAVICVLFMLAITLPYLWALAHTPPGTEYSGLLFNPDDQNVYLGWARQAHDGAFFFRDTFTHETLTSGERPLFTNGLFYVVGLFARLTGLPIIILYHLVRVGFAVAALWWFFRLCTQVIADSRVRIMALIIAAFGCGAGWLQPWFPSLQLIDRPDLSSSMIVEAYFFASCFVYPLNVFSFACLLSIFSNLLTVQQTGGRRPVLWAGLAAFALSNVHTYDVIPLNLILLYWAALQTPRLQRRLGREPAPAGSPASGAWRAPLIVLLWTLPPLLYQFFVFHNSMEFRVKALTPKSPPYLSEMFVSYILLLPLALYGAYLLCRNHRAHLIMLWAAVCFACTYLPVSFGRKMIEGVQLPLSILAAAGLVALIGALPSRVSRLVIGGGLIALLCFSSAQFVGWCLARAGDNNASRERVFTPPVYINVPEADALRFLSTSSADRDRALLCMPYLGNYVPGLCNRVVFIGHWDETLYGSRKLREAVRFYQGKMPRADALKWLRDNRIGLIYTGSYERKIRGGGKTGLTAPPFSGLIPVYRGEGVRIDRVPQ